MLLCLCGEIQPPVTFSGCYLGSSPLTRGIQSPMGMFPAYARFTPAHAGNTLFCAYRTWYMEVHPRSRGEYLKVTEYRCQRVGSPPLTRGIPAEKFNVNRSERFTPAHAGNTLKKALFYLTFSNTHFHISFNF